MVQDLKGDSLKIEVSGIATPLLFDSGGGHDAIIVRNLTPGTVVYFDDTEDVSEDSPWFFRFGDPAFPLPFMGQAWGRAYATTDAAEDLDGASVNVRPVVASSPLERNLLTDVARLYSSLVSRVQPTAPGGFHFDRAVARGTDLTVDNNGAWSEPTHEVDLTGRTLSARGPNGVGYGWIRLTAVNAGQWNQAVQIEVLNMPATGSSTFTIDIVASLGSDDRAVIRGRIRGI